ncbi:uncharacterized protein MONOS_3714 [Monocercomonoides exilis]|uniref:uncharacterized protein n=1 Tax=Monocercomonoides exilis TaxID=2049356 RepID=UPI0035594946|nr:hypothetical protein MONOS_3714 [Monocercomonoides exilis]
MLEKSNYKLILQKLNFNSLTRNWKHVCLDFIGVLLLFVKVKRKNQVLLASIQKNEEQLIMKTENARDLESQLGREAIMDDNLRTEVGALQEVADKKLKINEAKITNLRTKYEEYSSKARSYHMFFIQQPSYQPIVALKAELASLQMEDDFTNDTTKQNVIDELSEELASLQREVKEKKEQREERMKELKINHSLMAESQHGEDIQRYEMR